MLADCDDDTRVASHEREDTEGMHFGCQHEHEGEDTNIRGKGDLTSSMPKNEEKAAQLKVFVRMKEQSNLTVKVRGGKPTYGCTTLFIWVIAIRRLRPFTWARRPCSSANA